MSSAAVAAANIAAPPEGGSESGVRGTTGSADVVLSADDPIPNRLVPEDDEDDSDVGARIAKRKERRRNLEENDQDGHLENNADLFGEDDDNDVQATARKPRQLDDEELDSGDDMDRNDRAQSEDVEAEAETKQVLMQELGFARQPLPQPSDGEMYLLKVPKFMAIEPQMFHTPSFQVPTTEHHSRKEASATFSAYNTAMSTIRWRHSPSKPEEVQSNARILRWSDGSLTLQLGSDPSQQYELDGKPLAPPQKRPAKPTPVSINKNSKDVKAGESYTYLAVPEASVGFLRVTHKITAGLSILPSASTSQDAEERLRASLAAAVKERSNGMSRGINLQSSEVDPESKRLAAEAAEKLKIRDRARREKAAERAASGPRPRVGRPSGGLTTGMLEDDEGAAPRSNKKARRRAHNDEYSEDEDYGRKKANFASEEYEKDDFVASDEEEGEEEEEAEVDESDPDEGMGDVASRPKQPASPKRARQEEGGEDAEDEGALAPKRKKTRVIDDDEDE